MLPSTEPTPPEEITGRRLLHLREEQTTAVDDGLALKVARAAFLASVEGTAPDSLVTHGSDPRNRYTVKPAASRTHAGVKTPGKRELPPQLPAQAKLFCDLPQQSRRLGELQHAPDDAPVTALGDVPAGRAPGRRNALDITVLDSSGIGRQDLHLGLALLDRMGVSL
ncbi:hypothetical protein ACWGI8_07445 [Streptomyces sp. NPDC054841]